MDPVRNPYSPGAGTPPPELAGRDELRETVRIALERIRRGRPSKSVLIVGLRGVGKTVLLDRFARDAEGAGLHTMRVEAPEGRSLPGTRLSLVHSGFKPDQKQNFAGARYGWKMMGGNLVDLLARIP